MSLSDSVEYQETTTTTLEWTLRGLKNLFDSSRGEQKSKVTKSIKFGQGRWQVLFYANSGTEGGAFVSLYLSCEPTAEEKEKALNGKWVREGLFKFSFELRNVGKGVLFNTKEACDHSFSYKTANWGWAQFARRDAVYYSPNTVRHQDAFLIICTITSAPLTPSQPSTTPRHSVPRGLLEAVGALLDDPAYSDVEFILPSRRGRPPKRIWACRRLLKRAEYFETMFGSGFAEGSNGRLSLGATQDGLASASANDENDPLSVDRSLEDSDEEDEEDFLDTDFDETATVSAAELSTSARQGDDDDNCDIVSADEAEGDEAVGRNVQPKLEHPSSPRTRAQPEVLPGPPKIKVVVRDVAYSTYRAVLYYLYTDTIVFAPLSSNFLAASQPMSNHLFVSAPSLPQTPAELNPPSQGQAYFRPRSAQEQNVDSGPSTRKDWIREWEQANPGRVGPCSAKAVYRLADKLDLGELKERAFQHIVKSLNSSNAPYEVFSSFSAAFEEVRKVQVDFFLANWSEIRGSEAMRTVWQQIRIGRHPGFEEVWPVIAVNLEYKPRTIDGTAGDAREAATGGGEA